MRVFVAFSLVLPLTASAWADQAYTLLDPVVVTATRTPEKASRTLASVSVITRDAIELRQAQTVVDALRSTPGLAIANSGGRGRPTSVFLRGTESDHVLVLVDGVKVGSPTLGSFAFEDMPIDQIERIEVVRGPRSSLYGSEAIGGVIQIFTRKGGGPLSPRFSVTGGSYDTYMVAGGLSGGGDKGWFDVNLSYEDSAGFDACRGEPYVGGCFTDEPDDDGYRNTSGGARAGYRFTDRAEVDIYWTQTQSNTEFDGTLFSGNRSDATRQVLGAKLSLMPLDNWDMRLSAGRSREDTDVFYFRDFVDRYDTQRDTGSWQNDLYLDDDHLVTLGLDYQVDRVDATVDYAEDSRHDVGIFGEYQGRFGAHEVNLSLRHDDNQQFGGQVTGSAAWGYDVREDLRLLLSYGTAFKAPTFNELYFPFFGNPNLDPEESVSLEVGVAGDYGVGTWSLSLYQTDIDQLIAFDALSNTAANVDSARIRGLELMTNARIEDWELGANLTLMDPENHSNGPDYGNLLARRPQQSFRLDLDRTFGKWRAGGSIIVSGRRFDDFANRVRLDGFTLVDLRADYLLTKSIRVQGRVENLLDEDYETAAYYNQPGRSVFLTVRYAAHGRP